MPTRHRAECEYTFRIEQFAHVWVSVIEEPDTQAGFTVGPEVLPPSPQRIESSDGFGMVPPLRAPGPARVISHLAPVDQTQIVLNKFDH
ncbi:MAG: hypothetical protein JWN03_4079 [Nocardia sp.]|nr:hypothetical protein [Nocardia sp.]